MIKMKAEAVVITKPDKNLNYNGANINMNGKVLLADVVDKGYKGAGILTGDVVLCTASGNRETKAAQTAMDILSQHIPAIKRSGDSFSAEADSFFNHAFRELSMQTGDYESFSATLLYNHSSSVYIANTGDNAVYTFDGMYLDEINFAEETDKKDENIPTSDINFKTITDIRPNTRIIVLSKEVYEYTTDEQILDILMNSVSTKQACQKLIDQASENGAESYVTVLIENLTPVEVPVADAVPPKNDGENYSESDEESTDSGEDITKPSKAPLIMLIILLVIVAGVTCVFFANQKTGFIDKLMEKKTSEAINTTEPTANMVTLPTVSNPSTSATTSSPSTTAANTTRNTTTTRRSSGNNNYSPVNNNYNNANDDDDDDDTTRAPAPATTKPEPTQQNPQPVESDPPSSSEEPSNTDAPSPSDPTADTPQDDDELENR